MQEERTSIKKQRSFYNPPIFLGTMPLNLFIYGRFISDDPSWTAQDIPYHRLGGTLLLLAVPVCIGMLLRSYCPNFTRKMMKIAKPLISIMLLVFFCLGQSHKMSYQVSAIQEPQSILATLREKLNELIDCPV